MAHSHCSRTAVTAEASAVGVLLFGSPSAWPRCLSRDASCLVQLDLTLKGRNSCVLPLEHTASFHCPLEVILLHPPEGSRALLSALHRAL